MNPPPPQILLLGGTLSLTHKVIYIDAPPYILTGITIYVSVSIRILTIWDKLLLIILMAAISMAPQIHSSWYSIYYFHTPPILSSIILSYPYVPHTSTPPLYLLIIF